MERFTISRALRGLALGLGLTLAVAVFAGSVAPQAVAATKKKKKPVKKATKAAPTSSAAEGVGPAKPVGHGILSTKSAVKEKKERLGPAQYAKSKLTAAERDSKADEKRTEEIEELKKIIPKIQDGSPQKADLLFQLSELWWEKSKFVYYTEMSDYEAVYQKYTEQTNAGAKGLHEPKENHRQSDLYRQQAIDLYQKILADYTSYPRSDEVLFNLAYNLYETDKKKEAIARYWDLIRKYPDSKFVPDAYIQMGEHFFNSNDLERARKAYEKALAFNIPQIYSFALYKLAWCVFFCEACWA